MGRFLKFFKSIQSKWARIFLILLAFVALYFVVSRACSWMMKEPYVYQVAYDPSWSPLPVYGKDYNITAFSQELLFAIAKDQDLKLEITRASYQRLLELLEDKKVHAILTSIFPDSQLEEDYLFSDPYYRFGAVLVVKKGVTIESLTKLPNQRIGVKRGSPILFHLTLDPSVSIVPYDSPLMILDELAKGELNAVLMDQLLSYLYYGGPYRDQLRVATLPLTLEGLRLVTLNNRRGKELIEAFNTGLKDLKANGTYDALLTRWDLYNPEKTP